MGRHFFRHGELHLVLLALLRAAPRHGYELLRALADLFGPTYQPSAGSVYPALTAMEDEGLIAPTDRGDRRVYRLTPLGERSLDDRSDALAAIEARTGANLTEGTIEPMLRTFTDRVRRSTDGLDPAVLQSVLDDALQRITEKLAEQREEP